MKRIESMPLSSSSSRRDTRPGNHQSNNIGCMSGIFGLVSKYHKRRKFLTSAEKQDKNVISSPAKPNPKQENNAQAPEQNCDLKRFSCDLERSPTIPSEIRLSSSVKSPRNLLRPPAVVARLMGLNEIPASPPPVSSAEKRRKLLEALEKCDEDLKSLKKIIESVQSSDHIQSSPTDAALDLCIGVKGQRSFRVVKQWSESKDRSSSEIGKDGYSKKIEKRNSEINSEQPSPVSVLDEISSPSSICRRFTKAETGDRYKKLRDDLTTLDFFHKITLETLPKLSGRRGDDQGKYLSSTMNTTITRTSYESPIWSSKAKVESVTEVCKDAVWEQRWELGRIGVVLEDYMFGELIEEIVKELGFCYMYSLPFEACKRRLCF